MAATSTVKNLSPEATCERAGVELLVADTIRHPNPLDDPERDQRLGALGLRQIQDQRRWLDRPVLRAEGTRRGQESNWIRTLPGEGFYPYFRFYGPKEGVFDGTWKMPDIELVK